MFVFYVPFCGLSVMVGWQVVCLAHKLNREDDAMDCNRWRKQINDDDDHDRCEWVNVSSCTSSPGLSQTKSTEP